MWTANLILNGEEYRLVTLSHQERLSEVPQTSGSAILVGDAPVLADLIGQPAKIVIEDPIVDSTRTIAGIVTHVTIVSFDEVAGSATHRLDFELAPRLTRLSLRTDCRTFQKMTAEAIAVKVLEGAGYAAGEVRVQLTDTLPERVWVVQHNETDLAFLLRLLSEEGISLAVETDDEVDTIALFEGDLGACTPDTLRFDPTSGMNMDQGTISDLQLTSEPRPGKVTMREYDFEKPRLGLEVVEEADADTDFEVFDYPGRYADESAGKRKARLRLEALRTARNRVTGVSSALGTALGKTVTIDGHPYAPMNAELLLTGLTFHYVEGSGGKAEARLQVDGVPLEDGPVRPPIRPAAATAPGLSSAFVTGASGQEIAADEHGRVTLWFPWDRVSPKDDTASLGVRALQLALGGSQLTPRVGWEVSVGAFEADLDAPLVLNRMMNAAAPPPYPLPAGKTKFAIQTATSPGGGSVNEIRFDDAAGGEEMFMNASKDASVGVGNNATDKVTVDELRTISGNQSIEVGGGWTGVFDASQVITVGGSQTLKAATKGADESGSHTLAMGGSRSLTVGGDYKKTASGASTLKVGGSVIDLVMGTYDTTAKTTFDETIGAADVILASKKSLHVTGARSETAGAAKVILVAGDRAVAAKSLDQTVAGAIGAIVRGDRSEEASGDFNEVAGAAQIIQGTNVVFEAESLLSIVMGASTLTLTPDAIAIVGATVKLDGTVVEGIAVVDL